MQLPNNSLQTGHVVKEQPQRLHTISAPYNRTTRAREADCPARDEPRLLKKAHKISETIKACTKFKWHNKMFDFVSEIAFSGEHT